MTESVAQISHGGDRRRSSTELEQQLHDLTLNQALLDFELANVRVRDLTQRLIEANGTITGLHGQIAELRAQYAELEALHNSMRSSQAFKLAARIWAVRNALKI